MKPAVAAAGHEHHQRQRAAAAGQRLIVVGSGIAGLYGALLAADAGADVVLLTKGALADSNTYYAQGGISAVLDEPAPGDTVAAHIADTLQARAPGTATRTPSGCCAPKRAATSPALVRFGVRFDLDDDGDPALGARSRPLGAAHPARRRRRHRRGDSQRAHLCRAAQPRRPDGSGCWATPVPPRCVQSGRRVTGVEFLHDGQLKTMQADAVLLATGGAGQLFAQTTNPSVATADGLALAWRAGAAVADLEFFQFHPTCMVRRPKRPRQRQTRTRC